MSAFDRLIEYFAPVVALRRRQARYVMGAYEAAKPSRLRKFRTEQVAPNVDVQRSAAALRTQARHLEQNHDIARGILRTITNNVVGPKGVGVEPQPRRPDGTIHAEYAAALLEAWRDWQRVPEVTHRLTWPAAQRMMCRTWIRDGESLAQSLVGTVPFLDHGTRVPFSLELFEPDMVPLSYDEQSRKIRQGIQRNAWGKPTGYWVYKTHPGEIYGLPTPNDLKFIPADNILHVALLDRIGQLRGVSEFASVITRLEDIKDYEESERIAAKIAARLTGYVKRGSPDMFDPDHDARTDENGNITPREISIQPGTLVDSLSIGEDIGLIDSTRPNPNLVTFRQGQLRAVAGGIGASYSSIARDYDGTYSAQRQELVEQWVNYAVLTDEFTGQLVQPVWEAFVLAAHLSGVVRMPADIKPGTHDDALYLGQSMPWIDPLKEANAWVALVKAGFASEVEVMRKRGVNPADVMEQIADWRKKSAEHGLKFDSDAANAGGQQNPVTQKAEGDPAVAAAMSSIAAAIGASANREQPAPQITVHPAAINVEAPEINVQPSPVDVRVFEQPQPAAKPRYVKKTPVRGERGLIDYVIEETWEEGSEQPVSRVKQTPVRDEATGAIQHVVAEPIDTQEAAPTDQQAPAQNTAPATPA